MPLKQIRLTCGHAPYFQTPAPQTGDEIYCTKCGQSALVEYAPPKMKGWQWSCLDVNCKRHHQTDYGSTENAKRACWRGAVRHARIMHHDTVIAHDGAAVWTTKSAENVPKLF